MKSKQSSAVEDASTASEDLAAEAIAEIASAPGENIPSGSASLSTLYDLSLPVAVELGRAEMTVDEVLKLGRGSVIELERLAGEPVDIFVGDRRFAEAEVVVVGENFGVRITRLLASPNSTQT